MGEQFLLESRIISLQAGDLAFERRAVVGDCVAQPTVWWAGTDRDLAGTPVEPQKTIVRTVKGEAAVLLLDSAILGARRCGAEGGNACDHDQKFPDDHLCSPDAPALLDHKRVPSK